jgi:hypothetical protein
MSTIGYGMLTRKRLDAPKDASLTVKAGVGTYVDALAALVPAEVLAAQAVILSFTTTTAPPSSSATKSVTQTTLSTGPLKVAFFGLIVVSIVLYGVGFRPNKSNVRWFAAGVIPPVAFVAWTMIQPVSAFTAVAPNMDPALGSVIAILVALVLPVIAGALAVKLNNSNPPSSASTLQASPRSRPTPLPGLPTDPEATQVRNRSSTGTSPAQ